VALAACAVALPTALPASARPVTAVGVAEREFTISPYRRSVPAGRVRFNVRNFGEDVHNLELRGPRGYRSPAGADIRPDAVRTISLTLRRRGRYTLLCTEAGHDRLGMRAKLRVR